MLAIVAYNNNVSSKNLILQHIHLDKQTMHG